VTAALATLPKQEQLLRYPDPSTDPIFQYHLSRIQYFNDKLYNRGANAALHPNWPHLRTLKRHHICCLHKRRKYIHNNYLDSIATNLEKEKRSSKYFNISKKLQTQPSKQKSSFKLNDPNNNPIILPEDQLKAVHTHYSTFFNSAAPATPLQPFNTPYPPGPLPLPILTLEITTALNQLSNGKAPGPDLLPPELLKYIDQPLFLDLLCILLNEIFINSHPIDIIHKGYLITFNKPNKDPLVTNLRPITLLPLLRKLLELITLNRARAPIAQFIGPTQSASTNRSCADILWTFRFLQAYCNKANVALYFEGIDLAKAFDTVDRTILLSLLFGTLDESTYRLIHYLLSDTILIPKIGRTTGSPLTGTTGVPQGGALSVLLFTFYLEAILKRVRTEILTLCAADPISIPIDIEYVDDTDFIATDPVDLTSTEALLPNLLSQYNFTLNNDKTEYYCMRPNLSVTDIFEPDRAKKIKKLGSYISPEIDLQHRMSSILTAFRRLNNIWLRSTLISTSNRLRLFNAYIYPLYIYNLGAVAYTKAQLNKLDCLHRKQLRILLRVFWPNKIHNKQLYQRCRTAPISIIQIETRWRLFGHILRLPDTSPPRQAMLRYFTQPTFERPGRPPTTLPVQLDNDLQLLPAAYRRFRLKTPVQFERLTNKAQNRQDWKCFTDTIVTAFKRQSDITRHRNETKRNVPSLRQLNHPFIDQDTPEGMDFRFRARRITLTMPPRRHLQMN
jgi:hypothetical protein